MQFNELLNIMGKLKLSKWFYTFKLFPLIIFLGNNCVSQCQIHETTPQLIESHGFKHETYYVTTDDGYILTTFRMINPYINVNRRDLKPVLFWHGFLSASHENVFIGGHIDSNGIYTQDGIPTLSCDGSNPNHVGNTLSYVLSACGYDVWLGNARGTTYSLNHTHLDYEKDKDFWKFSFDEYIKYDAPTTIKYILKFTNKPYLAWVGASFGATVMFGLLSAKPSFERFVKPVIQLGPTAHVGYLNDTQYVILATLLGPFLGLYTGPIPGSLPFGEKILPDQSSSMAGEHLYQLYNSKCFRKFDYGINKNLKKYGQNYPPNYPLCNITTPNMALFYSDADRSADPRDVAILRSEIKVPLLMDYLVPEPNFIHGNFIYHKKGGKLYITPILRLLALF